MEGQESGCCICSPLCVLCRKRADYLAAKKDVMDASNVALVLIGPGSVDQVSP
ncbi:hypothetical protein SLEP1_g44181 [Rubroshorea leprosula]|uniref:Uncharacterized protein n=1 Tax=Rubroshorea leprosula TaxID=152421 RepID=A0AAV5LGJ7_9ROSI|nr:hypothetical protein SLEP1_g44181 [Rubroshorea leprosula]